MTRTASALLFLLSLSAAAQMAPTPAEPAAPTQDANRIYRVGGSVTAPKVTFAPQPEFSEKARKNKIAGNCTVGLVVDATGQATQVHIVRSIAEAQPHNLQDAARSLDEKALEAVRAYRFTPATLNGKPVPVALNIAVNFQVF